MNDFQRNHSLPIKFYYGSRAPAQPSDPSGSVPISLAECIGSPVRLKSHVVCHGRKCSVDKVQQLPTNLTDNHATLLSVLLTDETFAGEGLSMTEGQSSLVERYIFSPTQAVDINGQDGFVALWTLPLSELEDRLTLAFNAFYWNAASQMFSAGSGSEVTATLNTSGLWVTTPTTLSENLRDHYVCNKWWLTAALIVTTFMWAMSIAKAILTCKTKVPDWFGYVAALTINNPEFQAQWTNLSTAMDGFMITKRLGDLKIAFTDLLPSKLVGKAAITHVDNDLGLQQPNIMQRGRWLR